MDLHGILLACLWAMLLLYGFLKWNPLGSRPLITALFTIKVLSTFVLQAIYTYYYTDRGTADIYRFFDDAVILHQALFSDPYSYWQMISGVELNPDMLKTNYYEVMNTWIKPHGEAIYNDNRFMVRINALMLVLSFGNYEVHGVFFSALAFLGLIWTSKILLKTEHQKLAASIAILLPSSLLWLSGGLKETILMFGLGGFIYSMDLFGNNIFPKNRLWLLALSILLLVQIKPYFLITMLPASLAIYIGNKVFKSWWISLAAWVVLLCGGYFFLYILGIDLMQLVVQKQHDFINHAEMLASGSYFHIPRLQPSAVEVLSYLPTALMNTLVKPWPWEISSAVEWLLAAENFVLIIISLVASFGIRRSGISLSPLFWAILSALPILLLIGMVTPVYGAIMRYRTPDVVLLIIVITPFMLNGYHRIQTFFRR